MDHIDTEGCHGQLADELRAFAVYAIPYAMAQAKDTHAQGHTLQEILKQPA